MGMTHIHLIGIGTGNPDHLTRQAEHAILAADLILLPEKGDNKADLADIRRQIIDRIRPDAPIAPFTMPVRDESLPYALRVDAWHDSIARLWAEAIAVHGAPENVALLVWGDPSLYDSTLRIAARLEPVPQISVVPGITSLQALTAAHAIPLNTINGPVTITTGRQLRDHGWPDRAESVYVKQDGVCSYQTVSKPNLHIWWGAYLGMPEQVLASGPVESVGETIIAKRAAARQRHGWIMDTYLLRRL